MRTPSRQERFSFQECADRRIIFWDEAKLDPSHYDNIKRMLAGDTCSVAVKFKEDQVLQKTPIIVCSNNDVFPQNDEYYNRIVTYRWAAYSPWPERLFVKKLHPIAAGILLGWAGRQDTDFDYTKVRSAIVQVKQEIINNV